MLKKIAYFLIAITTFQLTGCSSINASAEDMVYKGKVVGKPNNASLVNNISVTSVSGGKEMNLLGASQISNASFKSALEDSLQYANLYHLVNGGKYQLNADVLKLEQPIFGVSLKVTYQVHYNLIDKAANKIVFDKNITSSHTSTFSEAPVAIIRLKLANEGAARKNIQQLIEDLYRL